MVLYDTKGKIIVYVMVFCTVFCVAAAAITMIFGVASQTLAVMAGISFFLYSVLIRVLAFRTDPVWDADAPPGRTRPLREELRWIGLFLVGFVVNIFCFYIVLSGIM